MPNNGRRSGGAQTSEKLFRLTLRQLPSGMPAIRFSMPLRSGAAVTANARSRPLEVDELDGARPGGSTMPAAVSSTTVVKALSSVAPTASRTVTVKV